MGLHPDALIDEWTPTNSRCVYWYLYYLFIGTHSHASVITHAKNVQETTPITSHTLITTYRLHMHKDVHE